ncbi:trace amine-associated receptor 13c-like isoform X1 [Betta splendens]|uniref:Trace amine-associated receptor 13c-like isoform X1 n=1 Tax=Betta splendens TaxID=158456 RepID=A0A6P7LEB2_BETSP|nr:trace amine-associated receptor 13c-like isoform X1 [Betta splendens]
MTLEEDDELCFPQLFNSSCTKPKRSELEAVLTYITLSSISLLTTTLNMFVIISISHFKQLHTPTNFLLLSLAVSDFFVGLIMFFQIVLIDGCWFLGDATCSAYQYVAYVITSASVGTMVLICVDRYVAICDPLRYSVKVTQGRVQACVCLCWTSAVAYQSVLLRDNLDQPGRFISCAGECVNAGNYIAGLADLFFSFVGPVAVTVVLYMRVFAVAASQARAMRSQAAAVSLQGSVTVTVKRSELKAAVTLGVVVAVFLVCLCPYFIYIVILTAGGTLVNASSAAFVICLFYFNSCLNPLIYAFFYRWFRKCLKVIVTLQILQPDSSEANVL